MINSLRKLIKAAILAAIIGTMTYSGNKVELLYQTKEIDNQIS